MGTCKRDIGGNQDLEDSGCVHDDSPKKDIQTQTENVEKSENEEIYREASLLDLSDDVLLCILQYLSPHDLKALGFSCVRLGSLVLERSLWTRVDARGSPYGHHRTRWLLQALHSATTELHLTGLAALTSGCMGHVNRTRKEVEDEEEAMRPKPETEEDGDERHRQLYEQAVANLPEGGGEDMNNQPPAEDVADNPLVRQHARMHINPQPIFDLPRITTYPSWPDDCELLKVDSTEKKESLDSDGCPGPQFTLTGGMLRALRDMCPRLTALSMEFCNINCKKTSISLFPPTIRWLSLKGTRCYNLPMDKSFLFKIHDYLPRLEHLDLSECEWLEPASLLPLSKIPTLTSLVLKDCVGMTEFVAYVSLATRYGFRQLRMLDFRGCPVGDSEVSALGWLPELRELHLSPPRASAPRPTHRHYRSEPVPRHCELHDWEMHETEYYARCIPWSPAENSPDLYGNADEMIEQVEQVRDRFCRRHDMISILLVVEHECKVRPDSYEHLTRSANPAAKQQCSHGDGTHIIEVHARYPREEDDEAQRRRHRPQAHPVDRPDPLNAPARNRYAPTPAKVDFNEPGSSKRPKKPKDDNTDDNPGAGPSKRIKIDKMDKSHSPRATSSRYFGDDLNDSNNNERFDSNTLPGPSRTSKRVQDEAGASVHRSIDNNRGTPPKRVRIDNGDGTADCNRPDQNPTKNNNDSDKKSSKKCDKGKHKSTKNSNDELGGCNGNGGNNESRNNNNDNNNCVNLSSHVQFNKSERAIYINMGATTSGLETSIKIQSDALGMGCMYEDSNNENSRSTAEKSTNTEQSLLEEEVPKGKDVAEADKNEASEEVGDMEVDFDDRNSSDKEAKNSNEDEDNTSHIQPSTSQAAVKISATPQLKKSKKTKKKKESLPNMINTDDVEVIIVQHNENEEDSNDRNLMMRDDSQDSDSQHQPSEADVQMDMRNVEMFVVNNEQEEDEMKKDDSQEIDNDMKLDEKEEEEEEEEDDDDYGHPYGEDEGNFQEAAERFLGIRPERGEDNDNSNMENHSTNANNTEGSRSGSSQSTSTSSSNSSLSSQSASASLNTSTSSKATSSSTSSSSSDNSSRSSSNEELREEQRDEGNRPGYVRFRRVRNDPPIVMRRYVPEQAEPRHHVLYVNLGQQLHAVYRLLPGRPFFHPRSLQRTLSAQRLEFSSLVTDSAIRRFGRAEGEDVNIVNIGPNGPQFGGRDIGGRPNRSNLRILSATGYRLITDRSLVHLATSAPFLEQIDFSNTSVTADGVESFKTIRPECEVVFSKFKGDEEER